MLGNIWTSVCGRNENSPSRDLPIMHWVNLAAILFVFTCTRRSCSSHFVKDLAHENSGYDVAKLTEQAEDNIRWLRQAKERVEREEREKNSLATLTDLMIKDSFDSQLMSKIDILYDNQTDLTKELKFVPQVFNCGKEFDIFKVLELAKAHKNITTESPPCLIDEEDNLCTTKKESMKSSTHNDTNTQKYKIMKVITTTQRGLSEVSAEGLPGILPGILPNFLQLPSMSTTRHPLWKLSDKKADTKQLLPHEQTKLVKLKTQEMHEKVSTVAQEVRNRVSNQLQKIFGQKGVIPKHAVAFRGMNLEQSLDDAQLGEDQHVSEDQIQVGYTAQLLNRAPQQHLSPEDQKKNDAQLKLNEPQVSKPENSQFPIIQTVPLQTQTVKQSLSSHTVEHQVLNTVIGEIAPQKQLVLKQTQEEKYVQGDLPGNIPGKRNQAVKPISVDHDKKKQRKEIPEVDVSQVQLQHKQDITPAKQDAEQPSLSLLLLSEQQKQINQRLLQTIEKQNQQQLQTIKKQNQQQLQTIEKQNQQQFQTIENQNQQQLQTIEKQNHPQLQTFEKQNQPQLQTLEKQNQPQLQTFEKHNQQQFQTIENQNQQQLQTIEKQNQPQLQTFEKQNQQQFQTIEKQNQPQLQTFEKQNQQQFQILEKQNQPQLQTFEKHSQQPLQTIEKRNQQNLQSIENQPQIITAVTDSKCQHVMASVPVSEQHQSAQETVQVIGDQQQVLKQTSLPEEQLQVNKPVTEQKVIQQAVKPKASVIPDTSEKQAVQFDDQIHQVPKHSEAPIKGLPEGGAEKFLKINSDIIVSASDNVMVVEPSLNSLGNPTSKFPLAPENVPATALFWGNSVIHNTANLQNYDKLRTEQIEVVSAPNKLESSDIPGDIQENPKVDYLYYQDQDYMKVP